MRHFLLVVGLLLAAPVAAGPSIPMVNLEAELDAEALAKSSRPLIFGSFRYHRNTHTLKCMGTGQAFRCDVAHSNGQRVGTATAMWLEDGAVALQVKGRGTCPKEVRFKASEDFLEHLELDRLPAKI